MPKVKTFVFNDFHVNTYVIFDKSGECVIIDAACNSDEEFKEMTSFIARSNLKPVRLLNTHCHLDHVTGNKMVSEFYNLKVEAHKEEVVINDNAMNFAKMFNFKMDAPPDIEKFIEDGDKIIFGETELLCLHVPGHSPGSIAFYSEADKFVITGDVLFAGGIGRTDLPGGNYETLENSIKTQLYTLPDNTKVFAGHGEASTIGNEKQSNPFVRI